MTADGLARVFNGAKTPVAIVVAGGLVATAVWFTQRHAPGRDGTDGASVGDPTASGPGDRVDDSDPSVVSRPADPARRPQPGPAAPAPTVAPPPMAMPGASRAVVTQATEATAAAFEAQRHRVRACWDALPDEPDAPSSVRLDLSISYDVDGHVVASGVTEHRDGSRRGLVACLQPLVHALDVPPTGERVAIQVAVTVP